MTAALVVLALALAAAGAAAVALAMKNGKLVVDAAADRTARQQAEAQLQTTAREFVEYKKRTAAQLEAIRSDIATLERDYEKCVSPGARAARLEQLLSKAVHRGEDGGEAGPGPHPPAV